MSALQTFEKMLASGKDGALLRFGLATEYMKLEDWTQVSRHAKRAVELDAGYSAAWKLLGKSLAECGDLPAAKSAYRAGIEAAAKRGDKQAAKEMQVFLKRLEKRDSA